MIHKGKVADYQADFCMKLGKELRCSPREAAERVVTNLDISDLVIVTWAVDSVPVKHVVTTRRKMSKSRGNGLSVDDVVLKVLPIADCYFLDMWGNDVPLEDVRRVRRDDNALMRISNKTMVLCYD